MPAPLALTQSATAVAANIVASFLAVGGTAPYAYAIVPGVGGAGGSGGTINATTGVYTAPPSVATSPSNLYDTIQATDSLGAKVSARVLVGTPLLLFCEVLQRELGLPDGRVYLWDQKINQPTDARLYIAVSVPSPRPFANVNRHASAGVLLNAEQYVSMFATANIDIISRGPEARDRKEEVVMAFKSDYAERQQVANSFYIAKLPPNAGFINLSDIDGDAIPYRYRISVNLQYSVSKTKLVDSYNTFQNPAPVVNS